MLSVFAVVASPLEYITGTAPAVQEISLQRQQEVYLHRQQEISQRQTSFVAATQTSAGSFADGERPNLPALPP